MSKFKIAIVKSKLSFALTHFSLVPSAFLKKINSFFQNFVCITKQSILDKAKQLKNSKKLQNLEQMWNANFLLREVYLSTISLTFYLWSAGGFCFFSARSPYCETCMHGYAKIGEFARRSSCPKTANYYQKLSLCSMWTPNFCQRMVFCMWGSFQGHVRFA